MRNLLRCRRGSTALAITIALTPLIGVVAIGGEAGSWYVTHQHAQSAADAAAYSGAQNLACTLSGPSCLDTQNVDYRGKEFAAQNGFCNATGDPTYPGSRCATLPTGISQIVAISTLTTWNGVPGNFVQATVSQQQPTYLAKVLGLSTVNIAATAIAAVASLTAHPPCGLTLTGSFSFQGSANVNASGCDLASNDPNNNALNFTGGGISLGTPPPSLSAVGGCTGAATYCGNAFTYQEPVTNPFLNLNSDLASTSFCGASPSLPATCGLSTTGACKISNKNPTPIAYTAATPCANNGVTLNGQTAVPLSAGVYFISGTLTMTGGSSITGTGVTLILLPGATIDTKGGGTLTITGPTSAPSSLPAAFQSDASLFKGMALYDASSSDAQFGGTSNINLTGNIYAPTAAVTFQGDPVLNLGGGNNCGELIAASIAFNGNATLDDSGCAAAGVPVPTVPQYVRLVN